MRSARPGALSRFARLAALGLTAVSTGCSSDLLGPDFEDDFATLSGCADVFFYAVDAADEVLLSFFAPGLVADAAEAGESVTTRFELPDAAVTLEIEVGSRVSDAACDDVIENEGPRVERTYTAVGGAATVTIQPGSEPPFARGNLRLDDVVFRDADGHRVTVERLEWTDIGVGWLPG